VTAGPDRHVDRPPAWFVTTDQGVILAGPYLTRAEAESARPGVVNHLKTELARAGRRGQFIAHARPVDLSPSVDDRVRPRHPRCSVRVP
jgi:hypothetical protein